MKLLIMLLKETKKMKVGFIGLGTMGLPMTKNLLKAGYETYVVSRSRPPIEEALSLGAKEAQSPRELIESVDIVLTCLPLPHSILEVYEGENGLIAGASPGKIIIDHSTVSPELNEKVSEQLKVKGAAFMDGPVSGGPMGAKAGTLTIMCGGDNEAFDRAYDVLKVIGDHVVYVGATGNGSVIKIINNMLMAVHTSAMSEAFVMGSKAGVNPTVLMDILRKSSGYSKAMDWSLDCILDREFQQRFSINLLHKDVGLALELGDKLEVPLEMVKLAEKIVSRAKVNHGHEDVGAIIRPLEKTVGLEVTRWSEDKG
jgi:3-hydroxyisobutyrate dehydrogenase-like beta-hydroxyacid dehydrogenase